LNVADDLCKPVDLKALRGLLTQLASGEGGERYATNG
jgi:hypothetical protein